MRDTSRLPRITVAAIVPRGDRYLLVEERVEGRMVLNQIDAQFTFNEAGLIVKHHDSFNFWTWSRQALGTPGLLMGWTPFLRAKVQATANEGLQKFLAKK